MDIRGWHILSTLGMGHQPKDNTLCRACIHIAVIEHVFAKSGKYDARMSLMDTETKKRLYLPKIEGYWKEMGVKIPGWFPHFQEMLERLEAKYVLASSTIEVPIPGMDALSLCIDDKNLKLEKCSFCKTPYKCTVNARRCEASHPLKTKGKGKRVVVVPVDSTGIADFWDHMSREERLELVGDYWVPHTDTFVKTDGKILVATIDMVCESTHHLRLLRPPAFTGDMMMTEDDQIAKQMHTFSDKMIKAYTISQEKQLLALLEDERREKTEGEKKKEAKRYQKYLKRLEHQIFNRPSTTFSWWEEEEDDAE
jgi:hypothetical protein